ncbi:MAG: hypothetical protein WD875_12755 [Pirellulales bacterium]
MRYATRNLCATMFLALAATPLAAADGAKPAATPKTVAAPRPARAVTPWQLSKAVAVADESARRIYRIECRIVERQDDGQETVLSQPTVATIAQQPAQVQIAQATPLVTGAEPTAAGAAKPNITVITTGLSLSITVAPDRPGRASLDVSIERSDIESVDVTKHADGSVSQSARVASHTTRVIDSVELAKKFAVGLDDKDPAKSKRRAEFVVEEIENKHSDAK